MTEPDQINWVEEGKPIIAGPISGDELSEPLVSGQGELPGQHPSIAIHEGTSTQSVQSEEIISGQPMVVREPDLRRNN